MKFRIQEMVARAVGDNVAQINVPEHDSQGQYSTTVALRVAQREGKNSRDVAEKLAEKIRRETPEGFFERIEVAGPGFINFWISAKEVQREFVEVYKNRKRYGASREGAGKHVIVEYSDPNIAKQMHTGHLRTTIIGDALARIHEYIGYDVVRWNYLGDWGTQFGNLIAAYKMWGNEKGVEQDPIRELEALYVKFSQAAKEDKELVVRGREEFRKLENGDRENGRLWKWFKDVSLREINEIYCMLGVRFDTYIGEAFFEGEMKSVVEKLQWNGIAKRSEGALIVDLEDDGLGVAVVQKSDGASVYLTRDIAALEYRIKKYKPAKLLYVVGNEQSLHFSQLFAIAKRFGIVGNTELAHIKYGLVRGEDGKKMSTREGTSVSIKELIEKIVARARAAVSEKNPELSDTEKNDIARMVGIGALKYNDIKENRASDIVFGWDKMLSFTGDNAPYIQYTHARLKNILRKAPIDFMFFVPGSLFTNLDSDIELSLMRHIFQFPEEVEKSAEMYYTNNLAKYLYDLAVLASRLYESERILGDENKKRMRARLALIETTATLLKNGLYLLGIDAPEKV